MAPRAPYAAVPRALTADRKRVSPMGRDVYAALTRYADHNDMAHCTQRVLAAQLECSVPTIERAVRELREAGWVTVRRCAPGGPNVYRINSRPEPDAEGARVVAPKPPARRRALTPPLTDDGTLPSNLMAMPYRYRKEEENLASRGATLAEDAEDVAGSELDPEFVTGFQDGREATPAAKASGPRALAMELRSAWMARGPNPVAGDVNVAAVAGQIAGWRRSGVTDDEIRAMITLFVTARGYHIPGAPPWKAFLTRRKALLESVRTAAEAQAAENDPGYWRQGAYDENAEADAWYAAQFGTPVGA